MHLLSASTTARRRVVSSLSLTSPSDSDAMKAPITSTTESRSLGPLQCKALTKEGNQCKRKAALNSKLCHQHKSQVITSAPQPKPQIAKIAKIESSHVHAAQTSVTKTSNASAKLGHIAPQHPKSSKNSLKNQSAQLRRSGTASTSGSAKGSKSKLKHSKTCTSEQTLLNPYGAVAMARHALTLAVAWVLSVSQTIGSSVNHGFKRRPLLYGCLFSCAKGIVADNFAQLVIQGKSLDDLNLHRTQLFAFLGFFYGGFVQFYVYNKVYPRLFAFAATWNANHRAAVQTLFDLLVHSALVYLPFFYCVQGCFYKGLSYENCYFAIENYFSKSIYDDLFQLFLVWGPTNIITFTVIPDHLKIPFLSSVGFLWTVLWSVLRGDQRANVQLAN